MLDAGVFIGAARGDRQVARLMKKVAGSTTLIVATHTIAEFYRGGSASAVEGRLMHQWRVHFLDVRVADGKLAGELLARTSGNNSMDALLVAVAARCGANRILTGDPSDLMKLRNALPEACRKGLAIVDIKL